MRKSKTLAKIRNGEWVLSTAVAVGGSRIAELAGYVGFDCLWLDMEHKPCSQMDVFHDTLVEERLAHIAVETGHHYVKNYKINVLFVKQVERLLSVLCLGYCISVL